MPAQRAVLRGTVATRVLFAQQGKQRRGVQGGITFELGYYPGPVFLKWVRAGLPIMGAFQLRGQLPRLLIFASSALAHPRTRCRYFLGKALASFSHIQLHLVIVFHMHTTL